MLEYWVLWNEIYFQVSSFYGYNYQDIIVFSQYSNIPLFHYSMAYLNHAPFMVLYEGIG